MKYDIYVLLQPKESVRLYHMRAGFAALLQNLALWIIPHEMKVRFESEVGIVSVFNLESNKSTFVEKSYYTFKQELPFEENKNDQKI